MSNEFFHLKIVMAILVLTHLRDFSIHPRMENVILRLYQKNSWPRYSAKTKNQMLLKLETIHLKY